MPKRIEIALSNFQTGKSEDALNILEKILSTTPNHAFAWFLSAIIHTQKGDTYIAIEKFKNAIINQPNYPEALNNLGVALESENRVDEAEASYKKAIKQKKDYANAYYNLANIQKNKLEFIRAMENYSLALKYKPDYAKAMNNLSLIHQYNNNYTQSQSLLEKASTISKNDPEIETNLGYNLFCLFKYEKALKTYREILNKIPDYGPTLLNCGLLMQAMGRMDEARQYFVELSNNPEFYMQAMNNLAQLELSLNNLKKGWEYYQYRPSTRNSTFKTIDRFPKDIAGKSILLYKDQGIGDEIFFARFIPTLEKYNAKLDYFTDDKISFFLERAFPNINISTEVPTLDNYDIVISVGELPRLLLQDGFKDIPPSIKLSPLPDAVDKIKNQLPNNGKKNIAVTWEAGTPGENTLFKKLPTVFLGKQLASIDANIIVIQRNTNSKELKILEKALGRKTFNFSFLNNNLEEMLAMLSLVDDYYCVSNTNTHLMAMLNRSCHVYIPHPPEWRWFSEGNTSAWFPTNKLNRQTPTGLWLDDLQP